MARVDCHGVSRNLAGKNVVGRSMRSLGEQLNSLSRHGCEVEWGRSPLPRSAGSWHGKEKTLAGKSTSLSWSGLESEAA